MKYFWSFLIFVTILATMLYGLLFTGPGNGILRPAIESKLTGKTGLPAKLHTFILRPDHFDILLEIGKDTKIEAKGEWSPVGRSIDASYSVGVKELSNLQKLIGIRLNGSFATHGTIKGDKSVMKLVGESDVAGSKTDYTIELEEFEPTKAAANVSHLRIEKLLYMLNKPVYAEGRVDMVAKVSNLDPKSLDGKVVTVIKDGLVHTQPIKDDFNLSIPQKLTFKAKIDTTLKKSEAVSKVDFITSITTFETKAFTYDIEKGVLSTDYRITIPNLDKLYFLTNRHMKGKAVVTGELKASKEKLYATAHSNTLGGVVDAIFENGVVDVTVRDIQTVALTDMLLYPHIFDSRAKIKLVYDTSEEKGTMHAELFDGQILPNKMSFLLQQIAKFDITKEVYERTVIETKIAGKKLLSNLYMKSRLTEIKSKDALIDLRNGTIDTTLNIKIRKRVLPVKLKGSLSSPEIEIEAKELLRSKAKEEIEKRLPKEFRNTPAGKLLEKLF